MDLTVRAATEADLPAVLAIHTVQNDFGGRWFTNPFAGGKEARYEDLAPALRWLHGGPWMDPRLLALHVRRIAEAGGARPRAGRRGRRRRGGAVARGGAPPDRRVPGHRDADHEGPGRRGGGARPPGDRAARGPPPGPPGE